MLNGWISSKTVNIEHYDSLINLLQLLKKLTVRTAEQARKDYEYNHFGDYYCSDCESVKDECTCQYDDHPYYDDYYRDDEDTPSEKEKV